MIVFQAMGVSSTLTTRNFSEKKLKKKIAFPEDLTVIKKAFREDLLGKHELFSESTFRRS